MSRFLRNIYPSITEEVLGKGGFGEVYLDDYNGQNAAAKVRNGFIRHLEQITTALAWC